LSVDRLVAGSPAAGLIEPGDLILALDGKVVTRFREVERAVQKPGVLVTLWRDGAEMSLQLATVPLSGRDVDRVLIWAGATLQAPHRAMSLQRGIAPEGVFVAFFNYGSPATHYGLYRRAAHHRGRRAAHAGPRHLHCCGARQARVRLCPAQDRELERADRGHYTEARQALLASLRAGPPGRRQLETHFAGSDLT
jgi:hypothetical protein